MTEEWVDMEDGLAMVGPVGLVARVVKQALRVQAPREATEVRVGRVPREERGRLAYPARILC